MADTITPFAVEATHPRWSNLLLQGLTGVMERTLRSRITPTTVDIKGNPRTKVLQHQSVPQIPGMVLKVNPAKGIVQVVDPLAEDAEAQTHLKRYMKNVGISSEPPAAVPTREGKLDKDRMKTLCREVLSLITAGEMTLTHGTQFTLKDVDSLPGEYLLNPGCLIPNSQPRYEKDLEAYAEKLNSMGG